MLIYTNYYCIFYAFYVISLFFNLYILTPHLKSKLLFLKNIKRLGINNNTSINNKSFLYSKLVLFSINFIQISKMELVKYFVLFLAEIIKRRLKSELSILVYLVFHALL